MIINLY